jgi:hypothetical protein
MNRSPNDQVTEHFNQFPWNYWGMLSVRFDNGPHELEKMFLKWIRRLCITSQAKIQYVYVVEQSPANRSHIQFQLGPANVTVNQMQSLWVSCGGGIVNRIESYDRSKGSWYTVKDWLASDHKGVDTYRMNLKPEEQ